MEAAVRFSEDVIPLTALKINPGKVVRQLDRTRRPALLTSHGRGVAVMQDIHEYERVQEEIRFSRGVVKGLLSPREDDISLEELKARLELT